MSQTKTAQKKERRDTVINLRTRARDRALIDQAAQSLGKSRSDFILETVRDKAENILLNQRIFGLDERSWKSFNKILDEPANPSKALRDLLARKAPWE